MGQEPLVSIVMSVFNAAPHLRQSLASITAQTYPHWELIVCDDGSTDDSLALLESFAAHHLDRVTVLRNATNRKLAYSLNRCLAEANGELIARMDADDRCLPERLERQVAFLQAHPEFAVVGTAIQRFDDTGEKDVIALEPRPDRWSPRRRAPFAHATILMRKTTYDALGGYTVLPRTARTQDSDLWFRFFDAGFAGANLPEPMYLVRDDLDAIRRRGWSTRWNGFRTTIFGYRLLGYPAHWYIWPVLRLGKALVPARAVLLYRSWQARTRHDTT